MTAPGFTYRIEGIEGVTVDPAARRLLSPLGAWPIRKKTFDFLVFLIENRHRVVSKQELIHSLWNDAAVTDDVLVASVRELRKLFGDEAVSPRFIRTIPGFGYQWIGAVALAGPPAEPAVVPARRLPGPSRRAIGWTAASALMLSLGCWAYLLSGRERPPRLSSREVAWWNLAAVEDSGRVPGLAESDARAWLAGGARHEPGGVVFDGVAAAVEGTEGSHRLPQGAAPRSVAVWMQSDSTNGDDTHLFQYGSFTSHAVPHHFSVLQYADGRAGMDSVGGVRSRSRVDDGAWHLIAAVYEGGTTNVGRVYVDGWEEANGRMPVRPATLSSGRWKIGRALRPGGTPFRGRIRELRVFERALRPSEVFALFRCSSSQPDLVSPAGRFFYIPIVYDFPRIGPGEIRHGGLDLGGVQLATWPTPCAVSSLEGATLPEDIRISAEVLTPPGTQAGLYFRSRAAAPGDGIIGGRSAGYEVRQFSTGRIAVRCLNPGRVVAFMDSPDFDASRPHLLNVVAVGERLRVDLDGQAVRFDQGGQTVRDVSIPPLWKHIGDGQGTVGVQFSADEMRGKAGGQRVRSLSVARASSLE